MRLLSTCPNQPQSKQSFKPERWGIPTHPVFPVCVFSICPDLVVLPSDRCNLASPEGQRSPCWFQRCQVGLADHPRPSPLTLPFPSLLGPQPHLCYPDRDRMAEAMQGHPYFQPQQRLHCGVLSPPQPGAQSQAPFSPCTGQHRPLSLAMLGQMKILGCPRIPYGGKTAARLAPQVSPRPTRASQTSLEGPASPMHLPSWQGDEA